MRKSLLDLINSTFIYRYNLPNDQIGIQKSIFSTENDLCYQIQNNENISEIIYNSIIEYSFNEFDINAKEYSNLHAIALKTKLKYDENASERSKISYGFHGETILYCLLCVMFKAEPIISRGYFYNPLENSETKGYDSYHLVEHDDRVELWFGEVKFRVQYDKGIDSALSSIDKAMSDSYLERNILALVNHENNFNIQGSKIEKVLNDWNQNPSLNIIGELKQHNMKLIYPIIILYEGNKSGFNSSIKSAASYINRKHKTRKYNLSIDYSVYFIFVPMSKVREIKSAVIKWIESKKPLMS